MADFDDFEMQALSHMGIGDETTSEQMQHQEQLTQEQLFYQTEANLNDLFSVAPVETMAFLIKYLANLKSDVNAAINSTKH